jgi:hypothetical protein
MAAQGMSRGKVDFTRDGIEQLQKDVIAFLDQFDEMPVGLVKAICQAIIDYYDKHRPIGEWQPTPDPETLVVSGPKGEDISVYHRANTPLNPRGDIKTI